MPPNVAVTTKRKVYHLRCDLAAPVCTQDTQLLGQKIFEVIFIPIVRVFPLEEFCLKT